MSPATKEVKTETRRQSPRKRLKSHHGDDVGAEGQLEDAVVEDEAEAEEEATEGVEKSQRSQQETKVGKRSRMRTQATSNSLVPTQTTQQPTSSTLYLHLFYTHLRSCGQLY
jgi:hypothetical protein